MSTQRHSPTHVAKSSRSTGFTLIELLVVIAIIGLLASIILASLTTARIKGRDARRIADIRSLQNALELYASNHNAYPASLATLVTDGDMSAVPTDPLNVSGCSAGTCNQYAYVAYSVVSGGAGACNSGYHLGALLESAPTVSHIGYAGNGSFRCSGSAYTSLTDCVASATCLAASSGDFSGTGNVYDVLQ